MTSPTTACHTLIVVDPGQATGYAVARRIGDDDSWALVEVGQSKGNRAFTTLASHWRDGPRTLVVEDQYLGYARTIIGLIRDAQDWVCCGRLLGYDCHRMYPNSWICKLGPGATRLKREARKALARATCQCLGLDTSRCSDDMCDAVAIMVAAMRHHGLGELTCPVNPAIFPRS